MHVQTRTRCSRSSKCLKLEVEWKGVYSLQIHFSKINKVVQRVEISHAKSIGNEIPRESRYRDTE